jgi:hypothetical protein
MKRTTLAAIAAVPLALLAAACSSSSSSSSTVAAPATHSVTPAVTSLTGTEAMKGTVTGAAVIASTTTYHLALTGPVTTTGTWTSPTGNGTKVTTTFTTPAGNLVVNANAPDANNPPTVINASTCLFKSTIHATYVVDGAKSTGKFAGAVGSGNVAVTFAAYTPKLSNGKCNTSSSAQPLASGAVSTFTAAGPLTIKM